MARGVRKYRFTLTTPVVSVPLMLIPMDSFASNSTTHRIRDGIYEITDTASGQYLNSIDANLYNRFCDDALILQDKPSRLGKVRLSV